MSNNFLALSGIISGSNTFNGNQTISGSLYVSGFIVGSIAATNGVISGSSQINTLLPTGIVSGSSQITLSSTSGYNSVLNQAVLTTSNVQFNSLGIGMAATGTAGRIDASGDIVAFSTSDINFKENIIPIKDALSKVETISGNTYDWKNEFEYIHGFKGNDVGVIAQEIQKVLPEAVRERENGYLGVNYEKIIPLLIESIKELSAKVKELENK
jgi:hypothetical protein